MKDKCRVCATSMSDNVFVVVGVEVVAVGVELVDKRPLRVL